MRHSDDFHVGECKPSFFGGEILSEFLILCQLRTYVYLVIIHEDGNNSLSGAGILDDLICEEEILIVMSEAFALLSFGCPPKQKDETVDRSEFLESDFIFEIINLFNLNTLDSNRSDELCEDGWVRFDCAPLLHEI